jgi:arsenite oxidase small subunit
MKPSVNNQTSSEPVSGRLCMNRRSFLFAGGTATVVMTLASLPGFTLAGTGSQTVRLAKYPRSKLAAMSDLKEGEPLYLSYPYPEITCILVKMGVPGGSGVGPDNDIVCFTTICTHMGGPLQGPYKKELQILGACPLHLTTFDLTRHGMVISGHATESLPQIVLELEGENIYGAGVMGLVYGYSDNLERR